MDAEELLAAFRISNMALPKDRGPALLDRSLRRVCGDRGTAICPNHSSQLSTPRATDLPLLGLVHERLALGM